MVFRVGEHTNDVDVETQVDWAVPDAFADLADDLVDTEVVDVVRGDDLEPNFCIVLEVSGALYVTDTRKYHLLS